MGQTSSRLKILDAESQNVERFGRFNGFSFKGLTLVIRILVLFFSFCQTFAEFSSITALIGDIYVVTLEESQGGQVGYALDFHPRSPGSTLAQGDTPPKKYLPLSVP